MSVLTGIKNVKFADEESEFYRYDGNFYLVVLDNQKKKARCMSKCRSRMMEYGEATKMSREFCRSMVNVLSRHVL